MQFEHYHKSKPLNINKINGINLTLSKKSCLPKLKFTPPEKKKINQYFKIYSNNGDLPSPNDSDDDNDNDNDINKLKKTQKHIYMEFISTIFLCEQ